MAKLIREVRNVNHRFTQDELASISKQNAEYNVKIDEIKAEQKNVNAQYTNKVKTLEAKRSEASQKILQQSEMREIFCYARKNFNTQQVEYISMDGELIDTSPFSPRDYQKQLELKEEVAQSKLAKIQYFGMKYFYDEFVKIQEVGMDSTDEEITEALDKNRTKFISTCLTYLIEEKKVVEFDDDVEFDAMYEVVNGWYDQYMTKYSQEPKQEDYKTEEVEPIQEVVHFEETTEPVKKTSSKKKKKEDFGETNEEGTLPASDPTDGNDNGSDDEEEKPLWFKEI